MNKENNYVCVLCTGKFYGYGNNPQPLAKRGRCCNSCNAQFVVPVRLKRLEYFDIREKK